MLTVILDVKLVELISSMDTSKMDNATFAVPLCRLPTGIPADPHTREVSLQITSEQFKGLRPHLKKREYLRFVLLEDMVVVGPVQEKP